MKGTIAVFALAALLMTGDAAMARSGHDHHPRSAPIIAGQPNIRVTRSGNVVARHHRVGDRLRNGRVPLPRHRLGPGTR